MPVERSRGSRRTGADGTALVWTQPSVAPGIAFATNLTPGAFEESAAPSTTTTFSMFEPTVTFDSTEVKTEPATQSFFFFDTPIDETKPKRASHKRKSTPAPASASSPSPNSPSTTATDAPPAAHIPRPPNAFILFRSSFIRAGAVPAHIEPSHSSLSAIAGLTWASLPPAEKAAWHRRAKEEREKHRERFPGYAFRPRHRTTSTSSNNNNGSSNSDGDGDGDSGGGGGVQERPKRRQREVPPADRPRNAHIASLLLTGLAGAALDEAIARFDQERRERGEGGVEVRFGVVETPEGRVKAAAAAADACERATSPATRRGASPKTPRRRKAHTPTPSSASSSLSASPSSPTTELATSDLPSFAAFDFDLELQSFPPSPVEQQHEHAAFDWPYAIPPSSPFDGFDTVPSSPFDSYPPSPALSHASASSSSSWEDLSLSLSPLRPSPLSASSSMSSLSSDMGMDGCGLGLEPMPVDFSAGLGMFDSADGGSALLPPYDLDLGLGGLGCGMDMDAYLTSYVEGTQAQAEGLAAW
ncbi:hypothetical protein C8R46DRAFT_1092515 [Mycena filopes]|nr:hypothetical protein C8R46DRAFT_1092515 [Mycena filopes]